MPLWMKMKTLTLPFIWLVFTGKYFSEAFILESVNPQYEERLFIEFPKKYKFTTFCVQILFWMSKQKNNYCTQNVVNLYFLENSMNNLLSYCGLTEARMRASEKDSPVQEAQDCRTFTSIRCWCSQQKCKKMDSFRLCCLCWSNKVQTLMKH